ncbi:NAD(P)-binding protein [Tuber magnatum]|uniref:NAD(P)-binding protein n=1 Tax=Tuber magnatum TaxID=42249 RepID=A0A317SS44_9PEZI|nr:NAD(P)-binding protein [Tuber magnatum]
MLEKTQFYFLLTGANSGLGLSLSHRLLDDFLTTHPENHHLTLIITTRSHSKGSATVALLSNYLRSRKVPIPRYTLAHHSVDLTNLVSVYTLTKTLRSTYPHLDAVILNAGMGSFLGVDWLNCFISLAKNWIRAVTMPTYKIQDVGWLTAQETPLSGESMPTVFAANVFGHYFLAHEVVDLLVGGGGRIIWTSSLEAYAWTLSIDDLQGVRASHSYESSKRLTDVLALTSGLECTSPFTASFFRHKQPDDNIELEKKQNQRVPKMYVCHPGICGTSIIPLNFILFNCMILAFYIARWFGSPWHTISTYSGANAASWLALASDDELEDVQAPGVKWGSACTRSGKQMVKATDVEGEENRLEFEELGRECWKQMEGLRMSWKEKLDREATK